MTTTQPTKQQVRDYIYGRAAAKTPPPAPADIRRELGWSMIQHPAGSASPDLSLR